MSVTETATDAAAADVLEAHNQPVLGHAIIDRDHAEATELLERLKTAEGSEFVTLFCELDDHLNAHFKRENTLMTLFSYPQQDEHSADHTRVLGDMARFRQRAEQGRIRFAKAYVSDQLPGWLGLHISTMDTALVRYVNEKS